MTRDPEDAEDRAATQERKETKARRDRKARKDPLALPDSQDFKGRSARRVRRGLRRPD